MRNLAHRLRQSQEVTQSAKERDDEIQTKQRSKQDFIMRPVIFYRLANTGEGGEMLLYY